MINIGCDIGKNNLDVYLNGKLRRYRNDKIGILDFIKCCTEAKGTRVILEPSGGYEKALLIKLHEQKVSVSIVNPYYVRNFARSYRDLAKTDKIDAKMLSEYGEKMNPRIQERKEEYRFKLEELTERRDVLVETAKEEKLRLEKMPEDRIVQSIASHIDFLKAEIKQIETEIRVIIGENAKKSKRYWNPKMELESKRPPF